MARQSDNLGFWWLAAVLIAPVLLGPIGGVISLVMVVWVLAQAARPRT